ncbi:hypothetical protein LCGC14_0451460 [marine sediment metagenome]|uniref:Uncharacterized protein n=1 Tax=marine sediment metagenome TaxID=412755 RepID=A0A0F9VRN7_9ZZZZ
MVPKSFATSSRSQPPMGNSAAGALGKITGDAFTPDDAGVEAARTWWASGGPKRDPYDKLAL